MATMVRDLIERARVFVRWPEGGSDSSMSLLNDIDDFLERRHKFYTECALEHGQMAVYYLVDQIPKHLTGAVGEWTQEWDVSHAVSNAREAWHYASMLGPYWIQQEIERQSEEQRVDDALQF